MRLDKPVQFWVFRGFLAEDRVTVSWRIGGKVLGSDVSIFLTTNERHDAYGRRVLLSLTIFLGKLDHISLGGIVELLSSICICASLDFQIRRIRTGLTHR